MKARLERLLVRVVPSWAADALLGDLDEEYTRIAAQRGDRAALRWYARQVVLLGARYARHRRQPAPGSAWHTSRASSIRSAIAGLPRDLRVSIRQLVRSPVFAVTAILTLALGIGANAAVVAFANAVLFKPLAVHEPERLVRLAVVTPRGESAAFSLREFEHIRDAAAVVQDVAAVHLATVTFRGLGVQDQLLGEIASAGYFRLRSPSALIGRGLDERDDRANASPAAVISERFWMRLLAGDPSVLGRTVLVNGRSVTVVGVFRESFYGSFIGAPIDLWMPLEPSIAMLGSGATDASRVRGLQLLARLAPSATRAAAEGALAAVSEEVARLRIEKDGVRLQVRPGTLLHGRSRTMAVLLVTVLLTITAAILLIAASNVANLVLARAVDRRRDVAVRVALGAGRGRILTQLATDGLVLAGSGGMLGLLLSYWAARTFGSLALLPGLELRLDLTPDWRVAAATAGFAALAGVAASVLPGYATTRHDVSSTLKEGGGGSVGGRRTARLRGALVIVQVAIATLAAVSAGLLGRSGRMAAATDLGFRTADTFAMDIDLNALNYPQDRARVFYGALLDRIGGLAATQSVALANRAPLDVSTPVLQARYHGASGDHHVDVTSAIVAGRYFETVGIPLIAGRAFDSADSSSAQRVAIVNEVLARRLRRDAHPAAAVGTLLRLAGSSGETRMDGEVRVIGVARGAKYQTVGESPRPHVYLPHAQAFVNDMVLLVHTPGAGAVSELQNVLSSLDPQVQGFFPRTLEEHTRVSLAPARLLSSASRAAGLVAAALSALGLYGVVACLVSSRRREIAVRLALGATPGRVSREVLGTGIRLSLAGAAIGLVIAASGARVLSGILYDTSPWDPVVYASVLIGVMSVASGASWLPARHAARVDPLTALRD